MLTYRQGAAGAPTAATAMAAYLTSQDDALPAEELKLSEYYSQTSGVDDALAAGLGCVPTIRQDINPAVAEALGIDPKTVLTTDQLAHILAGRRADGSELPGDQRSAREYKPEVPGSAKIRHRISYVDLTLSAPKSAAVAFVFARDDAERYSIMQCDREARDETLRYIESQMAWASFGHARKGGGRERAHMAWINVNHITARPTLEITRADPVTGSSGPSFTA